MTKKRRPRNRFSLTLAIVLCIAAAVIILGAFTKDDPYEYNQTVAYWVEPGDTLWGIAREYSTPRQDVRKVVTLIENVNNCTATIHPGDMLIIPVFK